MFNMIHGDLYKMYKSPLIKILFAITFSSSIIMTIMAYLIPQGYIDSSMTGIGFMFSDVNIISILGAISAGVFICGDFDNKTVHEAIACGCSRRTVIVSKAISFFCGVVLLLVPYVIIIFIALGTGLKFNMGSVGVGFLNLLMRQSDIAFNASSIIKMLAVMITLIIVYVAQLSICVPLAFLLKKQALVVSTYYAFTILCAQLSKLSANSQLFEKIFSCTPFGGKYSIITVDVEWGYMFKAIIVSLIFIIIMIYMAYNIFKKLEIK